MAEKLRLVVADDHPLFRDGVVTALEKEVDFEIVAECDDGESAITTTKNLLPDVILLDIALPGKSGIAAASAISLACPATKIVMLTASEHEDDLMAAFKAGATGYILKGISRRNLAKVIRAVAAGEVYVSPNLASELLHEMSKPKPVDLIGDLSEREQEILALVAEGMTNREIGLKLHLSEKTIKHYMTNVLQKLHVRSRVQAALLAQEHHYMKKSQQ